MASVPVSLVAIGGRALAFVGVALALAASLPDYADEREKMTKLGIAISYAGAALVLVGAAAEHGWDWRACVIVGVALLVILCVLRFKGAVRGLLKHVKLGGEQAPQQVQDEPEGVVLSQEGNGENGDEEQRGADKVAEPQPRVPAREPREA